MPLQISYGKVLWIIHFWLIHKTSSQQCGMAREERKWTRACPLTRVGFWRKMTLVRGS